MKRKVFSLALKDDRVEQCPKSHGSEFQMWGPNYQSTKKCEFPRAVSHTITVVWM